MRLRHRDGRLIHLSYCTNVHPAEDLPGIIAQLDAYAVAVRAQLGTDVLGLGLWLSAPVAGAMAEQGSLRRRLRAELDARGLEVVTLNGFPYASFHAPVVKHAVYHPDWTTPQRLRYTLDLCWILADLLPDDAARGSVSTLPLAWRHPWGRAESDAAAAHLGRLSQELSRLAGQTGRQIRVAFEPEPGCVIETTQQAVEVLAGIDTDRLGICLDLAHLACAWEPPVEALARLRSANLPVVKVQVSAALGADDPAAAADILRGYAEPRFLHQTRSATGEGTDDLHQALQARLPGPWRVHYHVPLHAEPTPPLRTTVPVVRAALGELLGGPRAACDHFDVETYTWSVLPAGQLPESAGALAAGLAAELAFARDELTAIGLTVI
jgi:sugar phosphate isomerase/epimerase